MAAVFARMTTIQADPGRVEEHLAFVQALARDATRGAAAVRGVAVLVDHSSGRCVGATFWATEEDRRASADEAAALRTSAAAVLHGDITVEEWQSALVREARPPQPGCCVRVSRMRMDPGDVNIGMDVLQTTVVPATEVLDGFRGISLWMNPRTGRAILVVLYDSAAALARARGPAAQIRAIAAAKSHATIESVDEYDVVWTSWGPADGPQGGTQVPVQRGAASPSVRA